MLLEDQDRSVWDRGRIDDGRAVLERAMAARRPGPYQLQAAIAALHDEAPTAADTDWPQIVALYQALLARQPSPVVELNLAVAVAMVDGPAIGLAMIDGLAADRRLDGYHDLHAARADLLRRLGRRTEAAAAYGRALELATNALERRFLERRIGEAMDSNAKGGNPGPDAPRRLA